MSDDIYVLSYIWGFWDDPGESPCQVVSLHRTEERAIEAACARWNAQRAEVDDPFRVTTTSWHRYRTDLELVLSEPRYGQMTYAIHRAALEADDPPEVQP